MRHLRTAAAPVALTAALALAVSARTQEPAKPADPPKPTEPGKSAADAAKDQPDKPPSAKDAALPEQTRAINKLLADAWAANKIKPSRRSSDYEFIRRATLDIIGRIATPEEVNQFIYVDHGDRAKLIHRLLYGEKGLSFKVFDGTKTGKTVRPDYAEEYAQHWANIWTNWTMTRGGVTVYREQMQVWLEEQFAKNRPYNELVHDLLTATGKNNDNGAVNFILTHLGEENPAKEVREEGRFQAVPITSRTTRLFLGVQTQCTQCHDHPLNPERKQSEFWGVNAFFRQVVRDGTPAMVNNRRQMTVTPLTLRDDKDNNENGIIYFEKRNGVVLPTKPAFLDGRKLAAAEHRSTRREALAEFVTTSDNFGKAYVNRLWGHFFGRGLNEQPAVDDFGEHNKVVHPELLDKLAKDFTDYAKFDTKQLITWICLSDAYGLSCVANPTNAKPETEVFFSRMLIKAMAPEQLFESLMTATKSDVVENSDSRKKLRETWMNKLVKNFGDDEGNEITFNGTVVQALLMMNGKEINAELTRPNRSTVALAMVKHPGSTDGVIKELFMAALNRPPTPTELAELHRPRPSGKNAAVYPAAFDGAYFQDLFWALLNSNEFILNH
jgi:hypothetical protein